MIRIKFPNNVIEPYKLTQDWAIQTTQETWDIVTNFLDQGQKINAIKYVRNEFIKNQQGTPIETFFFGLKEAKDLVEYIESKYDSKVEKIWEIIGEYFVNHGHKETILETYCGTKREVDNKLKLYMSDQHKPRIINQLKIHTVRVREKFL